MRIRESFSLYKRCVPSGDVVYYYRAYDENGKRSCGHSTGQSSKTAAREWCNQRLRDGSLQTGVGLRIPTFKEFAAPWWDWETCPYLKSRRARRDISQGYAKQGRYAVNTHLIPAFGNKRIDLITDYDIDTWMIGALDKGFKHNTVNLAVKILRIMMGVAFKKRYIKINPCDNVELLNTKDEREIEILTPDEVVKLFPADWQSVWDDPMHYVLNKLAACTGMRHGELLGLRGEFVFDNYIDVCAQYNQYGYGDTKSHKARNIPIPHGLKNDLEKIKEKNGAGFLFSTNGGVSPVSRYPVYRNLYKALTKIGIDETQRKQRNLCVHSWRHFFNTTLIMANVSDKKVRSVTGHASDNMTQHYTHLDNTDMTEVIAVQEKLITPQEAPKKIAAKKTKSRIAKNTTDSDKVVSARVKAAAKNDKTPKRKTKTAMKQIKKAV
ncbi:site-specific integrase [Spirochaetia bacterium]|nr:site-specific integrase [Spirochaetia bacterium]